MKNADQAFFKKNGSQLKPKEMIIEFLEASLNCRGHERQNKDHSLCFLAVNWVIFSPHTVSSGLAGFKNTYFAKRPMDQSPFTVDTE